jgi:DNA-binding MarR family transcriptional regulator
MLMVVNSVPRDKNLDAVDRLDRALGHFKEVSTNFPLGQVHTFLLVALHEGKSLGELAAIAGTKSSTMSRYLLELSDKLRDGSPGHALVDRKTDPIELRRNQYYLSARGKDLLRRIVTTLYQ